MNIIHWTFMILWHFGLGMAIYQFHTRKGYFYASILKIAKHENPNLNIDKFRRNQLLSGWLVMAISIGFEIKHIVRK